MSTFIERMEHFVETFTQEDKSFDFFGLIKLNNLEVPEWDGGYDVVVSAKWLPEDEYEAIGVIITRIHETFNLDERKLYLGSVAILDKSEDFIKEILNASQNNIEVKGKIINGLSVREAIILAPKQRVNENAHYEVILKLSKLDKNTLKKLSKLDKKIFNEIVKHDEETISCLVELIELQKEYNSQDPMDVETKNSDNFFELNIELSSNANKYQSVGNSVMYH
ncbi:MAG: hypothetical protein RIT27_2317 [Pseudomonadota bacterium]|jgi:hypothetical protein